MKMLKMAMAAAVCAATLGAGARVKFVATGWDLGDMEPRVVAANADALAKTGIDGIQISLPPRTQTDGTKVDNNLSGKTVIRYETYADVVPYWREITRHEQLKESFLLCCYWGFNSNMSDEAAWRTFAQNFRVLARLAKEGGLKGILLDNEDYCRHRLFTHRPADGDYKTACKLARQRGREVFSGIVAEFPDVVFMAYWLLSQDRGYGECADPVQAMTVDGNLWPSFVNGMLDVLPPTAKLVDGEEYGYAYDYTDNSFAKAASRQLIGLLPLVASENRVKYRSQLSVGFGQYLDGYTSTNMTGAYAHGPVNGSRLEHLRLNLKAAAANADEYVWLYGEKFSWVKWQNPARGWLTLKYDRTRTWEDLLPGFAATLREVKNPGAGLMERILAARAKGAAANRFPEALAHEGHWSSGNKGTYTVNPKGGIGGELIATGVRNGCYELPVSVNPGETWVVDLYTSGANGNNVPSACYQDASGKWHWELGTITFDWIGNDTLGRRRAGALIRIPEKMKKLVVMLNCGQSPNDTVSFTDIMMAKCEE